MSCELERKDIQYNEKISSKFADISVDCDIIVPDSQKDVAEILWTDGRACITGSELQTDRILVYGNISYKIVYKNENNAIESISSVSTFTDVIDLLGANASLSKSLDYRLKEIDCKILNGRKLAVKGVVSIDAEVYSPREISPVSDVLDIDAQKKFGDFKYMNPKKDFEKIFSVGESLYLPQEEMAGNQIINVSGDITDKSFKVINNKVIVKGELLNTVLYTECETGQIKSISKATPFTEIFDVEGIKEDNFTVACLKVCNIKCTCNDDAFREIEISNDIRGRVYTYSNSCVRLLDDCYNVSLSTEIKKESKQVMCVLDTFSGQINIKDGKTLENKPESVLSINGDCAIKDVKFENNKILVSGEVYTKLLCERNKDQGDLFTIKGVIPFNYVLNKPENLDNINCDCFCQVAGLSYNLSQSGEIEIRGVVTVEGVIYFPSDFAPIEDVSFVSNKSEEALSSITVYFTEENEKLWDIAKQYKTCASKIKELNNLSEERFKKGTKLFIPKFKRK